MEKIELGCLFIGIGIGVFIQILLFQYFNKRHTKALKDWEQLLNEREELLNQRDTERYKVFKETFKDKK